MTMHGIQFSIISDMVTLNSDNFQELIFLDFSEIKIYIEVWKLKGLIRETCVHVVLILTVPLNLYLKHK